MPTPVIMPKFEMAQETGKVLAWLKREGDPVNKGDALLEVETDKVNQEVESPATGVLAGICAAPGQVVPIATPIAYILKPGEALPGDMSSSVGATQELGAGAAVGTLAQGSALEPAEGQPKATPLAARLAQEHGLDLAKIVGTGPGGRITREDVEAATVAKASALPEGKLRAVPAARRVARELGIDLQTVRGTGPEGRIQPEDVMATHVALQAAAVRPVPAVQPAPAPAIEVKSAEAAPAASGPNVRRVVPLTNIRRTIAERMLASVREAPQFSVSLDVDMTRSLAMVEDLKATVQGVAVDSARPKITLTALLVKAVAYALVLHPGVNASFGPDGIVEYADVNVGVATAIDATPAGGGLIVPVVRSAETLGLRAIAATLADLTGRAREGKLKLEDLVGGTFTVSNLGMFGIETFAAILNPPQAAILAVGKVMKRAVVTSASGEDKVEIKPIAALTVTADHRVLDGASAARFLATIQSVLEHPGLLLE